MKLVIMDGKSSEFLSFLLVTFCLWGGFAFGADDRCNYDDKFASCFRNPDYLRQGMRIERMFGFFRQNAPMQDVCSGANNMSSCIKQRTAGCRVDVNAKYKPMLPKIDQGIAYICSEKLNVFNANKACLQRQDVVDGATSACQGKIRHTAHRRYARHSCSDVKDAAKCVRDVVSSHCGAGEVGPAMERVASIFLGLIDPSHDCDSGATFGVSRWVLSFGVIVAVLRWYSG